MYMHVWLVLFFNAVCVCGVFCIKKYLLHCSISAGSSQLVSKLSSEQQSLKDKIKRAEGVR